GGIYFVGTNLDSLTYPFTFRKGDFINAQFNYLLKYFFVPDSSGGTAGYYPDVYAATTYSDNFELTILKRINNRLQGVFKGTVKKMDGSTLDIKKGVFDVEIEER
nr:hypothetical protein [Chitinophagaceae bacterium]